MTATLSHLFSNWGNLVHCFLDEKNKAIIKEKMGLKAVPFYIILNKVRSCSPRMDEC